MIRLKLFGPVFSLLLTPLLFASACSKQETSSAPWMQGETGAGTNTQSAPNLNEAKLSKIRAARANLVSFYMRTFGPLIKSGYYDKEMRITRPDHYAHRLWVREVDWTADETLKALEKLAIETDIVVPAAIANANQEAVPKPVRIAYFKDDDQFHRDHYAMYMSETGHKTLGSIPLEEFILGAKLDYGVNARTKRGDLAWTAALLATRVPPGQAWLNSAGQSYDIPRVLNDMLASPKPAGSFSEYGCYDYHVDYALGAAVRAGYSGIQEKALNHLRADIKQARETCEASAKRGGAMAEIILRIKLNGHLLEAVLRAGDKVFPLKEFGADVDRLIDGLFADSKLIGDLKVYQGPPDIFTNVPHAIHGLDLALLRFGTTKN